MNDLTRIASNIEGLRSLSSLNRINSKASVHQYRLSSGKRINSASDDTAGYSIAKELQARATSLSQANSNVGRAINILNIVDSGYQSQMSLLQTIKGKVTQAADDAMGTVHRDALNSQVSELLNELDEISAQTKWNNVGLLITNKTLTFHVGADRDDTFEVDLDQAVSNAIGNVAVDLSTINLTNASSAAAAIQSVDAAIASLAQSIQEIGDKQARLVSKEDMLTRNVENTEAIRSSIEDADFAHEQMEVMKLQILQQTAMTAITQANSSPQSVLSLFR